MSDGTLYLIIGFGIAGWLYWKMAQIPNPPNPEMVCQHCGVKGQITVTRVVRKQGVSGGKATGALFTFGASMLLTGLSRKQAMRHCACGHCGMEWDVA